MKRPRSTATSPFWRLVPWLAGILLLAVWQLVSGLGLVPRFLLPSPADIALALYQDRLLLLRHLRTTLLEAGLGLAAGVVLGFFLAVVMHRSRLLRELLYPLLLLSQTVPTVAIAPLLVLWLGYGILPKVVLIFIVTFFPMTVSLLGAFAAVDPDEIRLLRAMGADDFMVFRAVVWPSSLGAFFSALRVSTSYALVGAVIAEWLGGSEGLGVYMTRVRKSFAFDRMFAVIVLISVLSLGLLGLVKLLQRLLMPWERRGSAAAAGEDAWLNNGG
ncbi:MAG: ABC transporter permease [Bacillota bacterium]|nr:ABC transporter permease [Bacillota bacterium]